MPRRKEGRDPSSFGKALVNKHRKNLNRAHQSQSQLHVTDIIDDDSSRLRSIIDRNELDEFLSEAILKEKSYTEDKKNIYFVDKKTGKKKLLNEADAEHDEIREMMEKEQEEKNDANEEDDNDDNNDDDEDGPGVLLEYELLRIPRRPRWQDYSSAEEFDRAEKDSFLEWRRGVARIEEDRQRAAGAKTDGRFIIGKEITPFEKNLEIWKQLWRVIERCDILIQIVDARNPLLFRCEDLEKYVAEISKDKICLLVLNKADYLTREARRIWSNYFMEKGIKFIFWSAMKEQKRLEALERAARKKRQEEAEKLKEKIKDLKRGKSEEDEEEKEEKADENNNNEEPDNSNESENKESKSIELPSDPTELFTREQIFEYVRRTYRQYFPASSTSTNNKVASDHRIQVGMVGFPNVGKSSSINVLMGEKRVSVAPTPGKTKHFQTLNIDDDLCLADCPGLVFPTFLSSRAELVINGVLPIDQMKNYDNYTQPVQLVCNLINKEQYLHAYSLAFPDDGKPLTAVQLLRAHARLRGFVKDHGSPDESVSARVILKDFVNGKLLYCQPPPGLNETERKKFAASYQHGGDEYDHLVMMNNMKHVDNDPINNNDSTNDAVIKPVKKSQQKNKKKKPVDSQNDETADALAALSINEKEEEKNDNNAIPHHKINSRAIELTMKDEFAVPIDPLSIDRLVLEEGGSGAVAGTQPKRMTKRAERMAMKEMLHKKKGKREKLRAQNIPLEQVGIRVALRSADLAYRAGAHHTQPVQSTKIPDHMPIGDYQKPSPSMAIDEKNSIQQPKTEFVSVSANVIGASSTGISAALASLVQSVNKSNSNHTEANTKK